MGNIKNQKLYLCDGKACEECNSIAHGECRYTTNIEHAINKGKEMDFDENGVEIAMTDKEFAQYLFNVLWNDSGADCCSKCICNSDTRKLCDNWERVQKQGGELDLNICFCGMKAYAEKNKK